jgi:hypothetical protein
LIGKNTDYLEQILTMMNELIEQGQLQTSPSNLLRVRDYL